MAAISKQGGYEPSFRAGSCPLVGVPPKDNPLPLWEGVGGGGFE